jgi:integrase
MREPEFLSQRKAMQLRHAARLFVEGKGIRKVAAKVQVTIQQVKDWQDRWPDVWAEATAKAQDGLRRRCALLLTASQSRERMLKRPKRQPVELPAPPVEVVAADPSQHTVPSFLDQYMIPCCLTEAATATVNTYRKAARKFAVTMGNPPLAKVTNLTLAQYRDALKAMPSRRNGRPLSINTVIMYLTHLQTILDKAGPPVRRSRDSAGYLATVPWVKLPREELGEATIVSDEVLAQCLTAADQMRIPSEAPREFWRGILITARWLALRSRTLFGMEWRHVEWDNNRLVLPAALLKGRKTLVLPLRPLIVREALEALRRPKGRVFRWSHSIEHFRICFHRLQSLAGVDEADYFGLHSLRRTGITQLYKRSPAAATLLAGHGSPIITRMSYVNVEDVLLEAMGGKEGAA